MLGMTQAMLPLRRSLAAVLGTGLLVIAGGILPFGALPADDAPASAADIPPPEPLLPADATPAAQGPLSPHLPRGEFPFDFIHDRSRLEGTADTTAYFGMLNYVRQVDPEQLQQAAEEFLTQRWQTSPYRNWSREDFPLFADIIQHPEAYRGMPVTLRGHIQLHRVFHEENEYGLDPLHEVYLFTPDSQGHPAAVVFTENPDGIPVGEDRISGISATGYFLKLMTYPSRDGKLRYAPLILAREARWRPVVPARLSLAAQLSIAAGILVAVLLIALAVRRSRQRDAQARERERRLLGEDQPPDLTALP